MPEASPSINTGPKFITTWSQLHSNIFLDLLIHVGIMYIYIKGIRLKAIHASISCREYFELSRPNSQIRIHLGSEAVIP